MSFNNNNTKVKDIDDLELFEHDRRTRKTKIVATLGPASVDKIRELMLAGNYLYIISIYNILRR